MMMRQHGVIAEQRQRDMKNLRDSGATLKEIGTFFNISAERVRQILVRHSNFLLSKDDPFSEIDQKKSVKQWMDEEKMLSEYSGKNGA